MLKVKKKIGISAFVLLLLLATAVLVSATTDAGAGGGYSLSPYWIIYGHYWTYVIPRLNEIIQYYVP